MEDVLGVTKYDIYLFVYLYSAVHLVFIDMVLRTDQDFWSTARPNFIL